MLLLTHIDVGVVGALHQSLPPFLELPPDDQIEVGEDDEGSHRGEDDPGPGGVPQDVGLGQSQSGGSDVGAGVISTPAAPEVQAEGGGLRLEEL